jgi:hypothetical protein
LPELTALSASACLQLPTRWRRHHSGWHPRKAFLFDQQPIQSNLLFQTFLPLLSALSSDLASLLVESSLLAQCRSRQSLEQQLNSELGPQTNLDVSQIPDPVHENLWQSNPESPLLLHLLVVAQQAEVQLAGSVPLEVEVVLFQPQVQLPIGLSG